MDCALTCGVDGQGQGKYPCLQVLVKVTHSGQKALLHYNEEAIQINSKVMSGSIIKSSDYSNPSMSACPSRVQYPGPSLGINLFHFS